MALFTGPKGKRKEFIRAFQNLFADLRIFSDKSFRGYPFRFNYCFFFVFVYQLATKNLNIGMKEFVLSTQTVCKFVYFVCYLVCLLFGLFVSYLV